MPHISRASLIRTIALGLAVHMAAHLRAQLTLTLTPSDYNGYNIDCFGEQTGSIDLSVSGGTPPYTYDWSNGATTQDVSGLSAGYYEVRVYDSASHTDKRDITLTEPRTLQADLVPYEYTGGYNISCFNCFNGSIAVTPTGGVQPYTYEWVDGPTTEDRSQLDAGSYQLSVYDANSCRFKSAGLQLTQPERDDWTKSGNAGTDPGSQFIGTTDNKDVVFKSNGSERLRLKSNGDIKVGGSLTEFGLLYLDADGILRSGALPDPPITQAHPCRPLSYFPYWKTSGNQFSLLCPEDEPVLGTLDNRSLNIITHGVQRVEVDNQGRVLIGDAQPQNSTLYKLYVEGGIVSRDVKVMAGNFPDYVFGKEYDLLPLADVQRYIQANGHLPYMPSAAQVVADNGVEVGDLQLRLVRTVEEQTLYILQLEEKLQAMEQRLKALETSKH